MINGNALVTFDLDEIKGLLKSESALKSHALKEGCLARTRTLTKRSRISRATITPRGKTEAESNIRSPLLATLSETGDGSASSGERR